MRIIETYTKTLRIVVLPADELVLGDPHQVFTLISRDGIHFRQTDIAGLRRQCDHSGATRIADPGFVADVMASNNQPAKSMLGKLGIME